MRQFYIVFEKVAPVAQQLTWINISILLTIKDENKRNYYINLCIKQNLSKRKFLELIKNNTYERLSYKEKINIINENESLKITDMLKDPIYIEIEKLENLFIELGIGFAYVGNEVRLGNYTCDLLFFNYELNAFVVVELKVRQTKKEDFGQIDYYMNYIDKHIKKNHHGKTIGIIISRKSNKFVLSYCSNPNIYETTYKLINK